MAVPGKLEFAVNPDLSADPLSYTWVDATADTQSNAVAVTRGRSSPGATQTEAGSLVVPLTNTGDYTPYRAAGTHYPNMRRGLIVARHYINTGRRWLSLTGASNSQATTPDAASWNVGADFGGAVQFRSPVRPVPIATGTYEVFGQFTPTGNQRSWVLFLSSISQSAGLRVSGDGTAESDLFTSLAIPRPDAGPLTLGWEFDGNNGAGGHTVTWYLLKGTITQLLADKTAYLFGDADTNSGTITLHDSTGTVGVGNVPGSGFSPYPGGIERVYVRQGPLDSGTVVADADFTAEAAGTTSFADDAATPKTWTIGAGAAITDRKTTITGHLAQADGNYPGHSVAGTARRVWQIAGPLRRMRQGQAPLKSALFRRVSAPVTDTTVYDYYPLEDGRDAASPWNAIGGRAGGVMAMSSASDDTLDASEALPNTSGGQPFGWSMDFTGGAPQTSWEFTMLVNIPVAADSGASEDLVLNRIDCRNGTVAQWGLRINDSRWRIFAKNYDDTVILGVDTGVDATMFGDWMIVQLSLDQSGGNIAWDVDLIPLSLGAAFGANGTLASNTLGAPTGCRNLMSAAPQEGLSVGHFIVTSGAVAGWLARADTAYAGEPDTVRVERLFAEENIPMLVDGPLAQGVASGGWARSNAAGATPMGPQRPGLTLLDYLDECAQASHGSYGESTEMLALTYRSGITLVNQPAAMTLTSEVQGDLKPSDSDRDYVNDATVTRTAGSSARYEATGIDAPAEAGRYDRSKTVNVASDAHLPSQASWWVHESTWPEERHDDIPVELAKNSAQLDPFFDLNLGDRVVVTDATLPAAAAEGDLSQLVDGWTLDISPHLQTVSLVARPAAPFVVGVLDDDDRGKLDSSTSVLENSFVAGTSTSMDVDFTTGTQWTTAAGEYPLELNVGGARVTATACGAPSGTVQTFIVSATIVNGVAKTVPAGTEVHLWQPARLAP